MSLDFAYPNTRPDSRGWGQGYPNCDESQWVALTAPNGVGFGRVHKEIAELLKLVLGECIKRGYEPKAGQCWGSVCRCSHKSDGSCAEDSNGDPIPSNHSYGLAIDFNSLDNVYGAAEFTSVIASKNRWVADLFRTYGFRWLGPPINDWQHFDFAGTPADARAMTERARRELGQGDDDVAYQAFEDGWRARMRGDKAPKADAPTAFGWRAADWAATQPSAPVQVIVDRVRRLLRAGNG